MYLHLRQLVGPASVPVACHCCVSRLVVMNTHLFYVEADTAERSLSSRTLCWLSAAYSLLIRMVDMHCCVSCSGCYIQEGGDDDLTESYLAPDAQSGCLLACCAQHTQ